MTAKEYLLKNSNKWPFPSEILKILISYLPHQIKLYIDSNYRSFDGRILTLDNPCDNKALSDTLAGIVGSEEFHLEGNIQPTFFELCRYKSVKIVANKSKMMHRNERWYGLAFHVPWRGIFICIGSEDDIPVGRGVVGMPQPRLLLYREGDGKKFFADDEYVYEDYIRFVSPSALTRYCMHYNLPDCSAASSWKHAYEREI